MSAFFSPKTCRLVSCKWKTDVTNQSTKWKPRPFRLRAATTQCTHYSKIHDPTISLAFISVGYTLPVSTGRVSKMTPVFTAREHGCPKWRPCPWTRVSKDDTRVHSLYSPWTRPVDTGTVYRALSASNSVSIGSRLQQYSPINCTLYPKVVYTVNHKKTWQFIFDYNVKISQSYSQR